MSEKKIKIYLVDDHKIFVKGVASLLGSEKELEIAGFAFDGKTALQFLKEKEVDVLITDVQMPDMNGIELTRIVKEEFPQIKVIGLSMLDKAEIISELISSGADGYLLKDIEKNELLNAIHEVVEGTVFYSGSIAKSLMQSLSNKDLLTRREREIIKLIIDEYTNVMIADKLFISEYTVESHRKNIFRKTQAKSIVGLVKFAYENKLF